MHIIKQIILIGCICLGIPLVVQAQELRGRIRDKTTKEELPGATVYIPDLRTGSVSDLDGNYIFENLPKRKFLFQVKMLGYATISQTIDLNLVSVQDFFLEMRAIEKSEIVVTGSAFTTDAKRTSVAVTPVDKIQIMSSGSDNLVQALATTPGISVISTGNAIAKPVIRGLSFNRIVVVNEGIRQEGQQWGDEHGLEIDQFSADRIEILKGPSSLLFGSDALGGVINILEPLPPPPGSIRAEINSQYSTNNSLFSNSAMAEGNFKGFVWRGRASYKNAAPFKTPVERVYNSGFEEKSGEVMLGVHKSWGYSHLHLSRWFNDIGITTGERDTLTGELLNVNGDIATSEELSSRTLNLPFQRVEHSKISSVNNLILGKSQLRINLGLQQNQREEYSSSKNSPDLELRLETATYDVKYYLPENRNFETAFGVSGMLQSNENLGIEFLIPDYTLADFGVFTSVKKSLELTTFNAGFRYDHRQISGDEMKQDSNLLFQAFELNFSSISASAGITHQLGEKINLKANVGRGFRAPNIPELSSNGVHEGTLRYERGNLELKPESSLQVDLGMLYESKIVEISLNLFYNNIDNFIYSRHLDNEFETIDGKDYPVYQYVQGQSTLRGGEFTFDIHPINRLHFENSVSYVRGQNEALDQPLPLIPALKMINELKYELPVKKSSRLRDTYLKIELESCAAQKRIDIFETETEGYSLINLGIGTNFRISKEAAVFFLRCNNVFNTSYFDHLSRMKEIGVQGPGRNFSIGLMIPIGLK